MASAMKRRSSDKPADSGSDDGDAREASIPNLAVQGKVAGPWVRAMNRGFRRPELDESRMKADCAAKSIRRFTGVWDCESPATDEPVGTFASGSSDFAESPGRTTTVWAISSVTVSNSPRRWRREYSADAFIGFHVSEGNAVARRVVLVIFSQGIDLLCDS